MSSLTEGTLQFDFSKAILARKFDDPSHGLSHCMKAVDFVVKTSAALLLIEVKDPDDPSATQVKRQEFLERVNNGCLDTSFCYKFRDSFLYLWAENELIPPIIYVVLLSAKGLDKALLLSAAERLKTKLPIGLSAKSWVRQIASSCVVVNLEIWQSVFPDFPVTRVV